MLFFKKTIPLQQKSILASFPYRVKLGEHLIFILKKFGAQEKDIPYLLKIIKRLNPQIKNINRLYPGETIYLPKFLNPLPVPGQKYPYTPLPYVVKRGDSVVKLLKVKAHIPTYLIFNEYLTLFKKLNPQVKDINNLSPGQRIVLPLRKGPSSKVSSRQSPFSSISTKKNVFPNIRTKGKGRIRENTKRSLTLSLLSHLGFSILTGEEILYPVPSGEWISVNTKTTPIISSPWGEKFILVKSTSSLPPLVLNSLKKIAQLVYIESWDVRDVLQDVSSLTKGKMLLWQEKKTLIIPCNNIVIESRAYLQIAITNKKQGHLSYFIFFKKLSLSNYESALIQKILKRNLIHLYIIKKERVKELKYEHVGLSHLYIPTFSSSRLSSTLSMPLLCRYFSSLKNKKQIPINILPRFIRYPISPSLVITFKIWEIESTHSRNKIYIVYKNSPYVVALLRIRGYTAYLLPRCP